MQVSDFWRFLQVAAQAACFADSGGHGHDSAKPTAVRLSYPTLQKLIEYLPNSSSFSLPVKPRVRAEAMRNPQVF
jgi:hypothetical protein